LSSDEDSAEEPNLDKEEKGKMVFSTGRIQFFITNASTSPKLGWNEN